MKTNTGTSTKVERPTKTLRHLTLEKMRELIIQQYFSSGQRLIERSLCEQLGVSRSVVREVLRHLETEGLVETSPGQGPIVASIDADTTRQVYEMRSLLEGHAAAACALRCSSEVIAQMEASLTLIEQGFARKNFQMVMAETTNFYTSLFSGGGQSVALVIVQTLNARINNLRSITIRSQNRGEVGPVEMRCIVDAIRAKDPVAARNAAEVHVNNAAAVAFSTIFQVDKRDLVTPSFPV